MKQLRQYQSEAIDKIAYKVSVGNKRIAFQLATGGGKTVTFAALVQRYLSRNPHKRILIVVHRDELLRQARKTIFDWYNIIAEPVVAGMKYLPQAKVYVAMIETANNRLKKNPKYFGDVGMLIIDEAHLGNFTKLINYFPENLIIGFTATPIAASKKNPMKEIYQDIVCGVDIPDLIREGALVPNKTYHIKNINRKSLSISRGEFDDRAMGATYSKVKHVQNCIDGYKKFALHKKTIIFNCNVEHSKIVNQAFIESGFESRHLDGNAPDHIRKETLQWFKNTPNAILNNVGILTTGFDEPSVECVIINKATMSLPLWLQMTGRGSRPFEGKDLFIIIDMGGNGLYHGDWCVSRDWADYFHHPDKPSDGSGVAPTKDCPSCEALIHASVRVCPFCQADVSVAAVYDGDIAEFELLTDRIPVEANVQDIIAATQDKKEYYSLHQIKHSIIGQAKYKWGVKKLTDPIAYKLLEIYQGKVKEWCKEKDKKYNQWHKDTTTEWFFSALKSAFNWQPQELSIAI
jgi:superfamily II DNA or RNA helicase